MKALVLCAGRGTRLRPLTYTRAKAALPVAGRPVLAHILHYLHRFGFTDVGVVISPGQAELRGLAAAPPGQRVAFIVQKRPLGIAHAVQAAGDYLGQEPFLLYLGDNLTNEDLAPALDRFLAERPDGVIAVRKVPNPSAYGIAELNGDQVVQVWEKPANPPGNLAIAGIYLLQPAIHGAIRQLTPSQRGEYEITDALAGLLSGGGRLLAHTMTGWWQDMGTPDGMLAANALLLDTITADIAPDVGLDTTRIQGRVVIAPGVRLENVRLRGPLLIGTGSVLTDAYVGPYTSVGEHSMIANASLENSILLPGCRLEGPIFHLEDCLLGKGAVVEMKSGRAVTLLLGDDGRLQFPPGRR
jgi:glucose-1-phosphate thymidylyltransferase